MARAIYQYPDYPSDADLQVELYEVCQEIGDAEDAIFTELIEDDEVVLAEAKIILWKCRVREILKEDLDWRPDNLDWRIGCY